MQYRDRVVALFVVPRNRGFVSLHLYYQLDVETSMLRLSTNFINLIILLTEGSYFNFRIGCLSEAHH